jgi:hypothetical protein
MNTQMWKLKDRPGKISSPRNFADSTLKDRKIQNHP